MLMANPCPAPLPAHLGVWGVPEGSRGSLGGVWWVPGGPGGSLGDPGSCIHPMWALRWHRPPSENQTQNKDVAVLYRPGDAGALGECPSLSELDDVSEKEERSR